MSKKNPRSAFILGDLSHNSAMANASTSMPASPPSTKGRWNHLSTYASRIFFFLIVLQVPLFRVQCRSGMCTTPLHVTSSQLVCSEVFPFPVIKGLLYPGAVVNGLISNMTVPSWNNLLNFYNLTGIKEASAVTDLQRLEVLVGSYFSVAGSLIGVIKPGRMSMFGTLLIVWGLVKEGILGKQASTDPTKAVFVYPTMLLALVCAFLSVKYDLKKAVRSAPTRPVVKPLKSSSKSKLKRSTDATGRQQ